MADDNNVQAEAPAETTTSEIVDLDAVEAPEAAETEGEESEQKEETETEADPDQEGEEDGEDKPRKRSGIQRLKARAELLTRELALREARIEELQRQSVAGDPEDKEPKEADFNGDFFAFQRALTAYDTRQIVRANEAKKQTSNLQTERQALMRERATAHLERVEAAKEIIADYDKVLQGANSIALSPDVTEEILASEKSELLSYYLAKNPDKLRALNSMTGRELAKEIGRLEGSVRMPSAKTQTSAPPPAPRVKGGSSPHSQEAELNSWLKQKYGR